MALVAYDVCYGEVWKLAWCLTFEMRGVTRLTGAHPLD